MLCVKDFLMFLTGKYLIERQLSRETSAAVNALGRAYPERRGFGI